MFILPSSCVTPVAFGEYRLCELRCRLEGEELTEVCHSMLKGLGCTCEDGVTYWLTDEDSYRWIAEEDTE